MSVFGNHIFRSPRLQSSIDALAPPGMLIDHRLISEGDEFALLPEELGALVNSVVKVRRASGAARIVARELLQRLGQSQQAIPKTTSGMPIWPHGIVGSLAHESVVAVAAVAKQSNYLSLGIDIEPAEPLDSSLLDLIVTVRELETFPNEPCGGRLLFSIKEAVYKAVYPLDGMFLDHHDVEVCLASRTAVVRNGRIVSFRYGIATHIVVIAYISNC
jgi:4'-phosphopantetheinyl transferase EntD